MNEEKEGRRMVEDEHRCMKENRICRDQNQLGPLGVQILLHALCITVLPAQ